MTTNKISSDADLAVDVHRHYCITDDQQVYLPKRRRAPAVLPAEAPLPRTGEIVYLSSSSAWSVTRIVHEWRAANELHIEVWLEYEGTGRHRRSRGFATTQ